MGKSVLLFLLLVAWLSVSSASVLVVLSRSSALVCAFWRLVFATLLVAVYVLVVSGDVKLRFKMSRELLLSAISGVFLAAHFLTWMESLFYIPVSLSTTIVVTYPLLAMLYEAILGISKPTKEEIVGAVIAFSGVVIAVRPYLADKAFYGSLLALLGALTGAAYFTLGRLMRKGGVSLTGYTLVCYGTSSLVLLAYSFISNQQILPAEQGSWVYLVLLGLIPMLGGHTVINYLMKYMKSYVATVIGFAEAPGATILASLVLSQKIEMYVAVGMIVTLSGALYTLTSPYPEG